MQYPFYTSFAEEMFRYRYAQGPNDQWPNLARRMVKDVCGHNSNHQWYHPLMSQYERDQLTQYVIDMKFIPGGRYLYYAGRPAHFWNNCFLFRSVQDTREEWGKTTYKAEVALMSGGGIGNEYSRLRPEGRIVAKTGGIASGPVPLVKTVNEIGRYVMQGGSRRSAIFGSLLWSHDDILSFIHAKDWTPEMIALKAKDFNFPLPLDMTNISVNLNTEFIEAVKEGDVDEIWDIVVEQMLKKGEPGFTFNFYENEGEDLRNACGEVTAKEDGASCNLGACNLARIESKEELADVAYLGSKFLACGSVRSTLPMKYMYKVREKYRRLGLGLMGVHDWMLQRKLPYEMNDELRGWLDEWVEGSERGSNDLCDRLFINRPVKYRAIAPNGTIGIVASTMGGIEPLYAVAYKRRYLVNGRDWRWQYVIDATAEHLIQKYGLNPDDIETAFSLAKEPERRIKFQADMQDYVDHAISSTINLPAWGTEFNNEDTIYVFSDTLLNYCDRLRGITVYPDGSRGGQPLTVVPYAEAKGKEGMVFDETEGKCAGDGICGI